MKTYSTLVFTIIILPIAVVCLSKTITEPFFCLQFSSRLNFSISIDGDLELAVYVFV